LPRQNTRVTRRDSYRRGRQGLHRRTADISETRARRRLGSGSVSRFGQRCWDLIEIYGKTVIAANQRLGPWRRLRDGDGLPHDEDRGAPQHARFRFGQPEVKARAVQVGAARKRRCSAWWAKGRVRAADPHRTKRSLRGSTIASASSTKCPRCQSHRSRGDRS